MMAPIKAGTPDEPDLPRRELQHPQGIEDEDRETHGPEDIPRLEQ